MKVLGGGIWGFADLPRRERKRKWPILILSARGEKADKLTGFGLGSGRLYGEAYRPEVLAVKVKALIQRTYDKEAADCLLLSGGITIDKNARKVFLDREPVELNVKEYGCSFCWRRMQAGRCTRDFLFNQIWGCRQLQRESDADRSYQNAPHKDRGRSEEAAADFDCMGSGLSL